MAQVIRVLGLDLGTRRIGVALSDPLGLTAQRLTVLECQGATKDLDAVCALVRQHAVTTVVVGLPLTMRGECGVEANKAKAFSETLRRRLGIPVTLVDERLTTVQGERTLRTMGASSRRRAELRDQVAAQLILQSYLDATHNR